MMWLQTRNYVEYRHTKAFAGMLIVSKLGLKLGAKPILQPLFCLSPEVMVSGQMEDNYVDFNAARFYV